MQLINMLPMYYHGNITMVTLQEILSEQVEILEALLQSTVDQCTVTTAGELLQRWETILDVETNMDLPDQQRREKLIAKIIGTGTTTKDMIRRTAAAFSGGEVEVEEDNANSTFTITFVGVKGIPEDMESFLAMLEEIKPAHLAYNIKYTYTVWGALEKVTWDKISTETWASLRISKEV